VESSESVHHTQATYNFIIAQFLKEIGLKKGNYELIILYTFIGMILYQIHMYVYIYIGR